jgi:hypothetical protein
LLLSNAASVLGESGLRPLLDIWYAAEVFIQCIRGERKTIDTSPRGF